MALLMSNRNVFNSPRLESSPSPAAYLPGSTNQLRTQPQDELQQINPSKRRKLSLVPTTPLNIMNEYSTQTQASGNHTAKSIGLRLPSPSSLLNSFTSGNDSSSAQAPTIPITTGLTGSTGTWVGEGGAQTGVAVAEYGPPHMVRQNIRPSYIEGYSYPNQYSHEQYRPSVSLIPDASHHHHHHQHQHQHQHQPVQLQHQLPHQLHDPTKVQLPMSTSQSYSPTIAQPGASGQREGPIGGQVYAPPMQDPQSQAHQYMPYQPLQMETTNQPMQQVLQVSQVPAPPLPPLPPQPQPQPPSQMPNTYQMPIVQPQTDLYTQTYSQGPQYYYVAPHQAQAPQHQGFAPQVQQEMTQAQQLHYLHGGHMVPGFAGVSSTFSPGMYHSEPMAHLRRRTKQSSTWSPQEDKLLRELKEVQKLGWREISTFFHDRTPNACQFRWRRIISSLASLHQTQSSGGNGGGGSGGLDINATASNYPSGTVGEGSSSNIGSQTMATTSPSIPSRRASVAHVNMIPHTLQPFGEISPRLARSASHTPILETSEEGEEEEEREEKKGKQHKINFLLN
ncbi:hypothetical protein LELG_05325 [Lodderomyces elongisporus NRRL YB-4239]|uniref:Uncharacterized protein n=1 Tax=Lodderomyces elongisporus (strain ATCC 11503 / CBS 2605 / JCM 1781 / NBRC 1676 / NRRL YB-4239) TaxID=379508 RepID=A5E6T6_LODEL|nr:hypothetical protein LELG_05325 [Lodderomyces elongisporus NRRL YB-4239]